MNRNHLVFIALCLVGLAATADAAWPPTGLPVSTWNGNQNDVSVAPDGFGGVLMCWADARTAGNGFDLYAQRVDVNGNPLWTPGGVPVAPLNEDQPVTKADIVPDGTGGAIIVWDDERNVPSFGSNLYMQRLDANGAPLWGNNGIFVAANPGAEQLNPVMTADGVGGATIVWEDNQGGSVGQDLYAQRVDANGTRLWATTVGLPVCTASNTQTNVSLTKAQFSGALLTWEDRRNGTDSNIYVQQLGAGSGTQFWVTNGLPVSTDGGDQTNPTVVSDGVGGAMVVFRNGQDGSMRASGIRLDGSTVFSRNKVSGSLGTDGAATVSDGDGGVIVAWRYGASQFFAQRVTSSGNKLWLNEGVAVPVGQIPASYPPMAAADGAGGAIIVIPTIDGANSPIRGQRLSASGLPLWSTTDALLPISGFYFGEMVAGQRGDVFLGWVSVNGSSDDIYAQRLETRHGGWGHPEPTVVSANDVPNDQGGRVSVNWLASDHDVLGIVGIDYYSVWRALDPLAAAKMAATGQHLTAPEEITRDFSGTAILADGDFFFEWLVNQDAFQLPAYSYAAATLSDSTSADPAIHQFQVIAHNSTQAFVSMPVSGYSADNLPPAPAQLLVANRIDTDSVQLDWFTSGVGDPDLADYVIYRAFEPGVLPTPDNFLAISADTSAIDPNAAEGGEYFYVITSRDIHGNESIPSNEAVVNSVSGVDGDTPGAAVFRLAPNSPNPFNPSTEIEFTVPSAGSVELAVYDLTGRRIRTLVSAILPAGDRSATWDGRDEAGQLVPSGMYLYKYVTADGALSRKMTLVK